MSEAEFRAKRRQKFLTEKYFNLNVVDIARSIANAQTVREEEQRSGRVEPSTEGLSFKSQLKLVRLHYTAGDPIESLQPLYTEAVKWFEAWHRADRLWTEARIKETGKDLRLDGTPVYFEDLFHFQLALDMVSLGILLGQAEVVRRIAQLLVQYRHTDLLFESLIGKFIADPDTDTTEFFHERPYDPLIDAFYTAETPDEAVGYMKRYLDGWYKAFEGVPWHDGHLVQTDEYSNYEGYWAFEAAAVCVLHGIDDTAFRDHIVYPKDLADWAREHRVLDRVRPGSGNGGATADPGLRCEAGQPCPREGFWSTPAPAGSRRHFATGEIMPALGGDYGTTLWQRDDDQTP